MKINRSKLGEETVKELKVFLQRNPRSKELHEKGKARFLTGAPLNWMNYWAGDFRIYIATAKGAKVTDVDGNEYVDFCLGDTGAMTGHSPEEAIEQIYKRLKTGGASTLLPNEDHLWIAEEMERRYGLPKWSFALSASDANRFSIRWARYATGREKVLVFNHCYHGSVDETLAQLWDGKVGEKVGSIGNITDFEKTTKVVEFNDVEALRTALEPRDVALVLAEPAMTNMAIVLPQPGFLQELRKITRETGTLLLIDETHTMSQGFGGFTKEYNIDPDIIVMGKPIASGIPAGLYGFSQALADRIESLYPQPQTVDMMGIGTTLSGNAVTAAAIRATLEHVLTEEAFDHMIEMAKLYEEGVRSVIEELGLDWNLVRIGGRVEYWFKPFTPVNGSDVYDSFHDDDMHKYIHLALLNRGIILAPVHNMALMCPKTTKEDIDKHTEIFREVVLKIAD